MRTQAGGFAPFTMLTTELTSDWKAIMGMNPAAAWEEAGPLGIVGWKVIQLSAAAIVSNMPGFMPPLKTTLFIPGGQPDAPVVPVDAGCELATEELDVVEVADALDKELEGMVALLAACPESSEDFFTHRAQTVRAKRKRCKKWYMMIESPSGSAKRNPCGLMNVESLSRRPKYRNERKYRQRLLCSC